MAAYTDQVALITGAGSGIGRALALALAAEGARIAALDLHPQGLSELLHELAAQQASPGPHASAVVDVTDPAAHQAAVVDLEGQLGPTDLLIACAGLGRKTSASDFSANVVGDVLRVNLIGVANSIAAVLPGMRARRSGHLVALSSLASFHGIPHMGAYCASKAGVNALLDSLRVELRPLGIAVTTICPGWIRTPMTQQPDLPLGIQLMDLADAVRIMMKGIRARRPFLAFPRGMVWQLRMIQTLPRTLADWLVGRMARRAESAGTSPPKGAIR
jgi:NAD(P)-dependent dehydrogenase (short-subunit alcohol dehydrogenase family)